MAATVKKTGSKKSKRNVPNGVVHIQSTFNNTIVSITDTSGHVISWSSAGASGFTVSYTHLTLPTKRIV